MNITRQQRRYNERRASKPEPSEITRTSARHLGRNKGEPFSRMKLIEIIPAKDGKSAVFHVKSYTRGYTRRMIKATFENIDYFIKGLSADMKLSMIGR